jgi:hypothetical protein
MHDHAVEELLRRAPDINDRDLSGLAAAVNTAGLADETIAPSVSGSATHILWTMLAELGWLKAEPVPPNSTGSWLSFRLQQEWLPALRMLTSELLARRHQNVMTNTARALQQRPSGQRRYRLLVPSSYGTGISVSGTIGAAPDTSLLTGHLGDQRCARNRLPGFIEKLTFTVERLKGFNEELRNLYLVSERPGYFFLVSESVKDFFERQFTLDDLQTVPVQLRHSNGSPVEAPYFALKVLHTIDCIDPDRSTGRLSWSEKGAAPFTQCMVTYDLDDDVAGEFANIDGGRYASYPDGTHSVTKVALREATIGENDLLFRPALWPGFLIVEDTFARALDLICFGGSSGYYFWTLDLDDVHQSHQKTLHALR